MTTPGRAAISFVALLAVAAVTGAEDDALDLICPGTHVEDRVLPSSSKECAYTTELVVLGTIRPETGDIEVEEILYGWTPETVITAWDEWSLHADGERLDRVDPDGKWTHVMVCRRRARVGTGRRTLRLQRSREPRHPECWSLLSHPEASLRATPANLAGARALARARFEFDVLSSEAVLVGRQTGFAARTEGDDRRPHPLLRQVAVSRVIRGPASLAGRSLRVWVPHLTRPGQGPGPILDPEERVYLLGGHDRIWRHRIFRPSEDLAASAQPLPVTTEKRVREILAQRHRHPLVPHTTANTVKPLREITCRDPVATLLLMLESESPGARKLAERSLVLRPEEARGPVLAAIRRASPAADGDEAHRFRALRELVRVLAGMEERDPRGDLHRVIESVLAGFETGGKAPRAPPATPISIPEWARTDVDRTLVWTLMAGGAREMRGRYARRMRDLHGAASGAWRRELRLALDVLPRLAAWELVRALRRGNRIKTWLPLHRPGSKEASGLFAPGAPRSGRARRADGARHAFLDTGPFPEEIRRRFAEESPTILRVHDGRTDRTLVAFPVPGGGRAVEFAPDGSRVAVLRDDGTLRIYALPACAR